MMSVSVQYENLHTILYNPFFVSLGVCVGIGQCEHTITRVLGYTTKRLAVCRKWFVETGSNAAISKYRVSV